KEVGVMRVVGAPLAVVDCPQLFVWPSDRAAYGRLCKLLTLGKRRATKGQCNLSVTDFIEYSDGILAAVIPPELIPDGFIRQVNTLKDVLGKRLSLAAACVYESDNHA